MARADVEDARYRRFPSLLYRRFPYLRLTNYPSSTDWEIGDTAGLETGGTGGRMPPFPLSPHTSPMIYLDYNATTPITPGVRPAMLPPR